MKILITGAKGMLAQAIISRFKDGNELVLTDVSDLDITDATAVDTFVTQETPDLLINCAAYTAVDKAENDESLAYKINAVGPQNLARACEKVGTTLVHISTDYVFGGSLEPSKAYSEDDPKHPTTVYGRTKLTGEQAVIDSCTKYYIFRIAWLCGDGPNFVRTMLSLAKTHKELSVVNDQLGSPTFADDLSNLIQTVLEKNLPFGVYNATNSGFTSWAGFAQKIFELCHIDCKVNGVSTTEYLKGLNKPAAKRPLNSKLSKAKLARFGITPPSWEQGLINYLKKESYGN